MDTPFVDTPFGPSRTKAVGGITDPEACDTSTKASGLHAVNVDDPGTTLPHSSPCASRKSARESPGFPSWLSTVLARHVCRVNFARKIFFFWATNFLTKNVPKFSPKFLSLYSVGQKKSRKIPAKFPTRFPKFPCEKSKKIHRRASAGAQGESTVLARGDLSASALALDFVGDEKHQKAVRLPPRGVHAAPTQSVWPRHKRFVWFCGVNGVQPYAPRCPLLTFAATKVFRKVRP